MTAKYVSIPNTDLQLFAIGFGTVNAGTTVPDENLASCLDYYEEKGGNVIDTARVYGLGQSEEALGRYLSSSGKRGKFVLVSKGGHPPLEDMHCSRLSAAEVGSDLDASLKALKTDCIDLYFLHRDDPSRPAAEYLDMLESFRKAGKIRYYGCSNWSTKRMQEADEYAKEAGIRGFAANEMFYNIASDHMNPFPDDTLGIMDQEMAGYHRATPGNLAMPYFSVCSGFFHQLAKDEGNEKLKHSPYYTAKNLEIFARMKELCDKYQASLSQIMLGFYGACDFNCVPLFGTGKLANLKDALGVLDIEFDKDDFNF